MMQILKSGTAASGTITIDYSCSKLLIKGTSAAATVKINSKTFAVTTDYLTLDVDFVGFTVVSGTVDYIALG